MKNKLQVFYEKLEANRKQKSFDLYDDRVTHCYLTYEKNNISHSFEVRGWHRKNTPRRIIVSAVNWTLCAGPCSIDITESNVDQWKLIDK
jgi:hypothetical protein